MKAKELKEKKDPELVLELEKIKKELRDLRFKKITGVIENPLRIRKMRRDIARINTILHMNKIEKIKKELENME
jgi:large subunit ribosomal protein L29